MSRPRRQRRILGRPNSNYFKPAGIRLVDLNEVVLTSEEFEAIRLVDYENLSQVEAGEKMEVSQPTLGRILKNARYKISDSIVNGKAIKIND